jgi:hypothetical protein
MIEKCKFLDHPCTTHTSFIIKKDFQYWKILISEILREHFKTAFSLKFLSNLVFISLHKITFQYFILLSVNAPGRMCIVQ